MLIDVRKNFYNGSLGDIVSKFIKTDLNNCHTVITNFYTLRVSKVKIKCNTLIVFDSTCCLGYDEFPLTNVYADKILLLGNPSSDKFNNIDFIEYYHKFSKERLEYLRTKLKSISKVLVTTTDLGAETHCHVAQFKRYFNSGNLVNHCNLNRFKDNLSDRYPHECELFIYQRWYEIKPGLFVENIGKLIFEFNYFNKQVIYMNDNKSINDGLHHYLNLFGIDDNKTQPILISKKEIEDKLFYKQDDLILELL